MRVIHGERESQIIDPEGDVIFRGPKPKVQEAYMKLVIFNRHHYRRVAKALARKRPHIRATNKMEVWDDIVDELCVTFRAGYYFNEQKFRKITQSNV